MRRPVSRRRDEQKVQTAIVVALHREFDCRVVHVPNGGSRTMLEAIALKEMGTWAGHPDLIVYGRGGKLLLLEVKEAVQVRERNIVPEERLQTLSTAQKLAVPELRSRGFTVAVVDCVADAIAAVHAFGFGPRATAVRSPLELRTGL